MVGADAGEGTAAAVPAPRPADRPRRTGEAARAPRTGARRYLQTEPVRRARRTVTPPPPGRRCCGRVQEEKAVGLFYGQRALGIGALAPLNFIGTLATPGPEQPFKRLVRTGKMFETIFFGTKAEADRVLKIVDGMHKQVVGEIPEDSGPFRAGTPYSAIDPELMLWTMAVMADSAKIFYELFLRGSPPTSSTRSGTTTSSSPSSSGCPVSGAAALRRSSTNGSRGRLADRGAPHRRRTTASAIMFEIPVPLTRWPAMRVHNLIMLGSLPPRVRELYGLRWTRRRRRRSARWSPASGRPGPLSPEACARRAQHALPWPRRARRSGSGSLAARPCTGAL